CQGFSAVFGRGGNRVMHATPERRGWIPASPDVQGVVVSSLPLSYCSPGARARRWGCARLAERPPRKPPRSDPDGGEADGGMKAPAREIGAPPFRTERAGLGR